MWIVKFSNAGIEAVYVLISLVCSVWSQIEFVHLTEQQSGHMITSKVFDYVLWFYSDSQHVQVYCCFFESAF